MNSNMLEDGPPDVDYDYCFQNVTDELSYGQQTECATKALGNYLGIDPIL